MAIVQPSPRSFPVPGKRCHSLALILGNFIVLFFAPFFVCLFEFKVLSSSVVGPRLSCGAGVFYLAARVVRRRNVCVRYSAYPWRRTDRQYFGKERKSIIVNIGTLRCPCRINEVGARGGKGPSLTANRESGVMFSFVFSHFPLF